MYPLDHDDPAIWLPGVADGGVAQRRLDAGDPVVELLDDYVPEAA